MAGLLIEMVTIDSTDPAALARWWAEQLGGQIHEVMADEFIVVSQEDGPRLGFQRVPDPTPGKTRIHLDLHADDTDAEVTRLLAAGASEVGRHTFGDFRWVVLADPDGNAFCVGSG